MTTEATPGALGSNEWLGAGSEAQPYCARCYDGDGGCVYPYYGVAPHTHDTSGTSGWVGSTRLLSAQQWPANFAPDREDVGAGTYTHCLECGAPNV